MAVIRGRPKGGIDRPKPAPGRGGIATDWEQRTCQPARIGQAPSPRLVSAAPATRAGAAALCPVSGVGHSASGCDRPDQASEPAARLPPADNKQDFDKAIVLAYFTLTSQSEEHDSVSECRDRLRNEGMMETKSRNAPLNRVRGALPLDGALAPGFDRVARCNELSFFDQ